jgi:hypothetical protein
MLSSASPVLLHRRTSPLHDFAMTPMRQHADIEDQLSES